MARYEEQGIALNEMYGNAVDALREVVEDPSSSAEFAAQVAADVAALRQLLAKDDGQHHNFSAYL